MTVDFRTARTRARQRLARIREAFEFDESKVSRDERGRFGEKDGPEGVDPSGRPFYTPDTIPADFRYNPTLGNEARAAEPGLHGNEVGPKFFDLPTRALQDHVILHERGHALSDEMLTDGTAFDIADQPYFPGRAGADFDSLNGQTTPGEVIAEAYATLFDDRPFLDEHFPGLADAVESAAVQRGYPLPDPPLRIDQKAAADRATFAYDPDQPRDEKGRFGEKDGGESSSASEFPTPGSTREGEKFGEPTPPRVQATIEKLEAAREVWAGRQTSEENAAVQDLLVGGYHDINPALRGEPAHFPDARSAEEIDRAVTQIDSAIAKAPTLDESVLVYRGVTVKDADAFLAAHQPGTEISHDSYSHTTADPALAAKFGNTVAYGYEGFVFEISTRSGSYVSTTNVAGDEREVLLERDARFRVVGVEENVQITGGYSTLPKDGFTVIQLEHLPRERARTASGMRCVFEYDPEEHPKGSDGRFIEKDGSDGGKDEPSPVEGQDAIDRMIDAVREPDSGFTIDARTGDTPTTGFAVAYEGRSSITPTAEFFADRDRAREIVKAHLRDNADFYDQTEDVKVGGWHDPVHHEIVFDPVQIIPDRAEAERVGRERNQQAIADLAAIHQGDWDNAIISTGGTGGREDKDKMAAGRLAARLGLVVEERSDDGRREADAASCAVGSGGVAEEDQRDDRGRVGCVRGDDRGQDVRDGDADGRGVATLAYARARARARLARVSDVFAYDPDQPRDEHGRFGEKDGGDADSKDSSSGPPPGWTAEPTGTVSREASIAAYEKAGIAPEAAARIVDTARAAQAEVWKSDDGKTEIRFGEHTELTADDKRLVADTVLPLREVDPTLSPVIITVERPGGDFGTSYGVTTGTHIQINAVIFTDAVRDKAFGQDPAYSVPSYSRVSLPEYILTHEYGHAVESDRTSLSVERGIKEERAGLDNPRVLSTILGSAPPSEYGDYKRTNQFEAYAEAYTEWRLTDGQTDVELSRRLAELEGWGVRDKSRTASATFEFDESKVTRDEKGRFGEKGGDESEKPTTKELVEVIKQADVTEVRAYAEAAEGLGRLGPPGGLAPWEIHPDYVKPDGKTADAIVAYRDATEEERAKLIEDWRQERPRTPTIGLDGVAEFEKDTAPELRGREPDFRMAEGSPTTWLRYGSEDSTRDIGELGFHAEGIPGNYGIGIYLTREGGFDGPGSVGAAVAIPEDRLAHMERWRLDMDDNADFYIAKAETERGNPTKPEEVRDKFDGVLLNRGEWVLVWNPESVAAVSDTVDIRERERVAASAVPLFVGLPYPPGHPRVVALSYARAAARERLARVRDVFVYDPDQPRDERGRFGEKTGEDFTEQDGPPQAILDLIGIPPGVDFASNDLRLLKLAAEAKAEVAVKLSQSMDAPTADMLRAVGLGPLMEQVLYRDKETGRVYNLVHRFTDEELAEIDRTGITTQRGEYGGKVIEGAYRADTPEGDKLARESAVDHLVEQWAESSNDNDTRSLAIQRAAEEEFGLTRAAGWQLRAEKVADVDRHYGAYGHVYREFVRDQYELTQTTLRDAGIREVHLGRGYHWAEEDGTLTPIPEWARREGEREVPLRPLSSWSADPKTVEMFAPTDGRDPVTAISARVPADRIVAFARTGVGSLIEAEFTVLGGTLPVRVDRFQERTVEPDPRQRRGDPWKGAVSPGLDVGTARAVATRNEDWLRTLVWDLPRVVEQLVMSDRDLAGLLELPCAEAMPPELRVEIAAYLRMRAGDLASRRTASGAREAFGYDPDQPRDEKGRFGEKTGDDAEQVPLNIGEPPAGWKTDPAFQEKIGGLADVRQDALARGLTPKAADAFVHKIAGVRDKWVSDDGKTSIEFRSKLSEEKKQAFAETVSQLRTLNPTERPVAFSVVPKSDLHISYAMGVTTRSKEGPISVQISGEAFTQKFREQSEEAVGKGRFAPAFDGTDLVTYVTTHEYGHAIETDRTFRLAGEGLLNPEVQRAERGDYGPPVSRYGAANRHEFYAEAYAEWRLSGGTTSHEATRRMAEFEKWMSRRMVFAYARARARARERLARIWETFAYDPDQPRDEQGRFGEKDGGEIPPPAEPRARGEAINRLIGERLAAGQDSESVHDRREGQVGRYSPERTAVHQEIVNGVFQKYVDAGARQEREAVMLAGLPGVGKSTVAADIIGPGYVTIAADEMKEALASRGLIDAPSGVGQMEASSLVHEESTKLAADLAQVATARGYNVVFDYTMGSTAGVEERYRQMDIDRDGTTDYKVTAIFVGAPVEQAVAGSMARYENAVLLDPDKARYLEPEAILRRAEPAGSPYRSQNERVFEEAKGRFDRWVKIDNTDFRRCVEGASDPAVIPEGLGRC